jgi:hypothetical protein
MIEILFNKIRILILKDNNNIKAVFNNRTVSFTAQGVSDIEGLIKGNLDHVYKHYVELLNKQNIESQHYPWLASLTLNIVFHYLCMYCMWNLSYKTKYSLFFHEKDFNAVDTYDMIIIFLKDNDPIEWREKCCLLTKMSEIELEKYWIRRMQFFNK